ncbi:homoserine O-acetyltransferase/O-succinyltransferase [Geosmithia morbida]|uniref:Homoserine O-acetyltransferase/O-succinyltransferase n=1 Tax=Geosmithia morbida TaxID=1094350 RepID=A0A9P4YWC2_9HYPO|nr:homoserine O-acetyltransferase/O-succinyltransferase [Geosmithia morbida]KAF4122979.1 homoserine O-acetyltransferase/O-succinyltransferase [Geosmithia morbida]
MASETAANGVYRYERTQSQPENPYAALIPEQQIAIIPDFTLESGVVLYNVPVAYTTRGQLSASGDNAMVICHALTGSADVSDWWGPLLGGPGKVFDETRFFIVCMNSLGSPYGTASPVTAKDGDPSKGNYGPEFPLTTIRDDVNLHKLLLDDLGVKQIAAVVGGSLGGMFVLEWAYLGKEYVRSIVPIATSSRHSAWGISWGEAQRQSIYADPKYDDGYYTFDDPPTTGLGAARMSALLTYRSRNSFESRFGRNTPDPAKVQTISGRPRPSPSTPSEAHFNIHNDGHHVKRSSTSRSSSAASLPATSAAAAAATAAALAEQSSDPQFHGPPQQKKGAAAAAAVSAAGGGSLTGGESLPTSTYFSAQSYLRYQGTKFVKRFDSNCYIAMTRKLDTHDVSRNRASTVADALGMIEQPTLVLGIESDGLFTFAEQQEIAEHVKGARLERIDSPEGHDAFLLQFEQVNRYVLAFLKDVLPDIMGKGAQAPEAVPVGKITKSSAFGEAEVEDITAW